MKKLKDLILEKLRINKDTEPYYDKFVFKPKESDANAKEISDLTVYLPFEILVNNKRKITIAKIQYEFVTRYKFDAWYLYDNNDKQILGLTNCGIISLLLKDEEFDIELKGESKESSIIAIKNSLNIVKESYLNEKLKINKETSFKKDPYDESTWEVGDIIYADGFRIDFYEIKSRSAKQFKLLELGTKLIEGHYNSPTYKAIPHGSPKFQRIVKGVITKNGMNIDGFKYSYVQLWDGEPVEGHGL